MDAMTCPHSRGIECIANEFLSPKREGKERGPGTERFPTCYDAAASVPPAAVDDQKPPHLGRHGRGCIHSNSKFISFALQ